jgi:hypothetical protein
VLYHLAINTDVFDATTATNSAERELQIIELLRGLSNDGTIANLHGEQWALHVAQQIEPWSQSFKMKFTKCLSMLKKRRRLIKHPRWTAGEPGNHADWLHIALEAHQRNPFNAIVLEQALRQTCGVADDALLEIAEVLDSPLWVERPQSFMVRKSASDYRQHLLPVLLHARTLDIVDPYLDPRRNDFRHTIQLCCEIIAQHNPNAPLADFNLHAGYRSNAHPNPRTLLQSWQQALRPLAQRYQQPLKVFLWEAHRNGERFHHRYILTDQCGISSNDSLECVTRNPSTMDWSLLDEKAHAQRRDAVRPGATAWYALLGMRDCRL